MPEWWNGRHAGLMSLYYNYKHYMCDDALIIESCLNSLSMSEACSKTWLHFNTFKKRALKLGCYKPNQSWIGISKQMPKILLEDILDWKYPNYQTNKLKKRLLDEGYIDYKCMECWIDSWNNTFISLELDHIDWNRFNHKLNNLKLLCPNCHSQTSTYRWKNVKWYHKFELL